MNSSRPFVFGILVFSLSIPATAQSKGLGILAGKLLDSVRASRFQDVIDYGPYNDACPGAGFCPAIAPRIANPPNVDIAVIQLDEQGNVVDAANIILSRDYPQGLMVPLDDNLNASGVRWLRWDIERSDGGSFSSKTGDRLTTKGWDNNPALLPSDDIVPGRANAPLRFMSPYPASLFKILVAYRVMRLVDAGSLKLDDSIVYNNKTRTVRDWMNAMITWSDNTSTYALLKWMHSKGEVDKMNQEFQSLGLATLQVNGTDPNTGSGWTPGQIHMTAMDTARLLLLIEGANGGPALGALNPSSRAYLQELLRLQQFNEVLNTGNFCGDPNVLPGIPAVVPNEIIGPDGTVTSTDDVPYGQDVRPCKGAAEVIFLHKTGLTTNYGSDAGIVRSLPGAPYRRYVIAFLANLGYRYTDPVFAGRKSAPCFDDVGGICYTQRIAGVARLVDDFMKK